MDRIEEVELDIKDISNAYDNLMKAINDLSEIEGLKDEYVQLDYIIQKVEDKKMDLERELEELEEEKYAMEHNKEWEREKIIELNQYWSDQF